MNAMQITEAGKQLVQSTDFASLVKSLLKKFQPDGMMSDDEAESRVISMVAWAAVGRDILKKPTPEELIQLEQFIDDHTEELQKLLVRRAQAQ
jgi:hypothetical protein